MALVVPNPRFQGTRPRAVVHFRQRAAKARRHLMRLHVSGFSTPDPQTRSQPRQQCWCGTKALKHASCQGRQCRRCIERESGGSDTLPTGMHDSPGRSTGGSSQEGMRRLLSPGIRGLAFRVYTTRQESRGAPAVARRLLSMDAGNVPSMRSKRAREAHCRVWKPAPRSSTPVRHHTGRPPPTTPGHTTPSRCSRDPKGSTGHGAPGAGACLRLQPTRHADPHSA